MPGGLIAQFRQAVANAEAVLATEGATLDDVVKATVFLVRMDDFGTMNSAYIECFGDNRPARSAVGVAALPLGALVEIELWAYVEVLSRDKHAAFVQSLADDPDLATT